MNVKIDNKVWKLSYSGALNSRKQDRYEDYIPLVFQFDLVTMHYNRSYVVKYIQ